MPSDIKMNYTEKGSGFPLVLLHGNGESGAYFSAQIEYFSEYYRVIAVDTRGHGGTPRGKKPFTIEQFADDLNCFFDELGIARAHVLGFSDGGNIAMRFAIKYHDRVVKLILNGANTNPAGVKLNVMAWIGKEYAGTYFGTAPFGLEAVKKRELLKLMLEQPNISDYELAEISAPTLVIAGTKDMIRASHTRHIAEIIPDAVVCILNGDHFIAARSSDKFNAAVHAFLKSDKL